VLLPRWFTDTAEAARHPVRAASLAGVLAAACWELLAYFVVGPHTVAGSAVFAIVIGVACAFGTLRGLRAAQAHPSRQARLRRARQAGLRLGVTWLVLLVFALLALALHSLLLLGIGVVVSVAAALLLRVLKGRAGG
jgi:hypothetical protein